MAGAMRKMGIYLGLVEDDDEARRLEATDGYEHYEHGDGPHGSPPPQAAPSRREYAYGAPARPAAMATATAAPAPVREVTLVEQRAHVEMEDYGSTPYRISTLCPSTYNEALVIGEHFRDGSPVIMNLTEMDDSQAKRLIDFAAGLTFGLRGRLEKVTNKVFLLSPQNIDVTAEDRARIAEGAFFNQS